jgi:hypothetical protein
MNDSVLNQQNILLQNRERIFSEMKKYPNVVHVGVGSKEINDEITSILCYRVYVDEKKPIELLKDHEKIPAEIDGFITDVIPYGIVEDAVGEFIPYDDGHYRPLKGGVQIRTDLYKDEGGRRAVGTLGCLVTMDDGSGKIVGLTASHVVAYNTEDVLPEREIGQPYKIVCCCCCVKNIIGKVLDSERDNKRDCAIIQLHDDIVDDIKTKGTINEILEIGNILGKAVAEHGTVVRKRGAATKLTKGVVVDISFGGNQILISPDDKDRFADCGDSGAIVVNERNQVIGLLWGVRRTRLFKPSGEAILVTDMVETKNMPRAFGVATPIDVIETRLKIKIPVPPAVIPTITIDPSDTKTYVVPSVLPAANHPKTHFVTAKGEGDIILKVQFDQSVDPIRVKWVSNITEITSPAIGTDRLTAKISRDVVSGRRAEVGVTVDGYGVGDKVILWIVWSKADEHTDYHMQEPLDPVNGGPLVVISQTDITVTANFLVKFHIQPSEIIPHDINTEDVPDLTGTNLTHPPNVSAGDTLVYNQGVDLSGGAKFKWDVSKRLRNKVTITHDTFPLPSGKFNQSFINYPSSLLVGNDDTIPSPIEVDPYAAAMFGQLGVLISDNPVTHSLSHSLGKKDDEIEFNIQYQIFARLELAGTWYVISDPFLWQLNMKYKKVREQDLDEDLDNDGDKSDELWSRGGGIIAAILSNDDF